MFEKDRLFAEFTLRSQAEFELYSKVADILEKDIIKPDMVVYLQADTSRLMKNIKQRGRDFEKGVTTEYINQVNEKYQEFFVNYDERPLLVINANNIDFVNNPDDFENLLEVIQEPAKGRRYFNPSSIMIKWIIAAGVLLMVYRFFNKNETISSIKKDTKIDYKKVKDAEFEDHE